MPFFVVRTNIALSADQERELKERLGRAIEHVPGKSEQGLMLMFEDEQRMWLAGKRDLPMAYIDASVFANESHVGYRALSAEIAKAFSKVANIAPERVYVRYSDIPIWSAGEMVADRRMFP